MRLWSLHPQQLDVRALVAVWREGLLARKVLAGQTVGYRNHPQLVRFRRCKDPVAAVEGYLQVVLDEAARRGYGFDASKITPCALPKIRVTSEQLAFEWRHLCAKVAVRDPVWSQKLALEVAVVHPCFKVVEGPIEPWERP